MTNLRQISNRNRLSRSWPQGVGHMDDVFGQMERMMQMPLMHDVARQRMNGRSQLPIDLYETNDEVVLVMAVPGMRPDQLDVSLEGRQLTVRGSLPEVQQEAESERNYWVRGIARGEFQRVVTVPAGVDADGIRATIDNGLLTLTLPKAVEAKARKIDVKPASATAHAPTIENA